MTMFGTRTGTCGTLWSPVRPSFVTRTVSAEPGEGQRPGAPPQWRKVPSHRLVSEQTLTMGLKVTSTSQDIPADMGPGGSKLREQPSV